MKNPFIDITEFTALCYRLLDMVRDAGHAYDGILCPLKGGFYLSHFMSRHLEAPLLYIEISSYRERKPGQVSVGHKPGSLTGRFLICDDIYDTGSTIRAIREIFPAAEFDAACLVTKDPGAPVLWGRAADKSEWVDFFWETI